jgi:FkbH-like protein
MARNLSGRAAPLTLLEALEVLKEMTSPDSPTLDIHLACGFTPLHFQTFLNANLKRGFPEHKVSISAGVFGDLAGNLERLGKTQDSTVVAIIEWQDLDPRLGIRLLGGWRPDQLAEIEENVRSQAARVCQSLSSIAHRNIVVATLPTLPLPPVSFAPGWLLTGFENRLHEIVASLAARLIDSTAIRMVSSQRLDSLSPPSARFDVKSELRFGFPYTLSHADQLAALLAHAIRHPAPKKGLITDLDDTFWKGILGEVGVDGISWDLDHHAQKHGLYQQILASLSEAGVLVGVASKNDPGLVEEAFIKKKPIIGKDRIFPLEVNWGSKSGAVSRILEIWKIGADSVVFVDDSALEVAEVKTAYPEMECIQFPREDDKAAYEFLRLLRDLFGKLFLSREDELRLESIRTSHAITQTAQQQGYTPDAFLQEAGGKLTVSFCQGTSDPRALELINKTNQFNINGKRHTESSWGQYLADGNVFVLIASYEDKFGPLGKVAVVTGRASGGDLEIDHWVMSCRAFSRRIEHACLRYLFHKSEANKVIIDYCPTPRNAPLQNFLAEIAGTVPQNTFSISRQEFFVNSPPVYLQILETP